jgi:pantoate--beta-alanine ligase
MTMGALHEGHAELVRAARGTADHVVVTVFVNPLQFGAGEDLDRYPRTLAADLAVCEREGADVVFTPTPDVVYPDGPPLVRVSAGPVGDVLEGASRPGHFDGVLTVVCKLLHLVRPTSRCSARRTPSSSPRSAGWCATSTCPSRWSRCRPCGSPTAWPCRAATATCPTTERRSALVLHRALRTRDADAGRALVEAEAGVELDYLERVDSTTFTPAADGDLLVVAARVGPTRLIDNVVLDPLRK